ncbi:MAG: hypothetical protein DRJ03_00005 [Chloroflexi bacterium]|nr:MAG: hypothetical protein DRJ03_00005 [Chloroflexota bacterium]
MTKRLATLLLTVCLAVGATGCAFTTTGEASWEVYGGIRTRQLSEEPAKVEIESSVVDKIVESLTDGEVTEAE